jgi:hypothetical protein
MMASESKEQYLAAYRQTQSHVAKRVPHGE